MTPQNHYIFPILIHYLLRNNFCSFVKLVLFNNVQNYTIIFNGFFVFFSTNKYVIKHEQDPRNSHSYRILKKNHLLEIYVLIIIPPISLKKSHFSKVGIKFGKKYYTFVYTIILWESSFIK